MTPGVALTRRSPIACVDGLPRAYRPGRDGKTDITPAARPVASAWRELVRLVGAAVSAGDARVALAGADVMTAASLDGVSTARRAGRHRSARNTVDRAGNGASSGSPSAGRGDGDPAHGGADPADPTTPVDPEHVESWHLVRRAQQGDGEAFGLLYDRYVDLVFRFIYYRVNDRALAEDFTSETFLRALRRIGAISYQGRDIGAWFVTIARNIVLDHVKSARARLETPTADAIEGGERNPSTETMVLANLRAETLMSAVAQLGDEQRDCVVLRFVQGMSVSETAQIMGKNDGAVKALQHRAVRKLADLVGNELAG